MYIWKVKYIEFTNYDSGQPMNKEEKEEFFLLNSLDLNDLKESKTILHIGESTPYQYIEILHAEYIGEGNVITNY